jgi:hypothetical protein
VAAVRPRKGRGAERNRALRMLAGSPLGCTEVIMLAHGFTVETLDRLVLDGLAAATGDGACRWAADHGDLAEDHRRALRDSYSITSSAVAFRISGKVRPSALAVLMLMAR